MAETKQVLRARLLAARRRLAASERSSASTRITALLLGRPEVVEATTVAAYVSIGTEPSTLDLMRTLVARRVRVLLPVLAGDGDLHWGVYAGPERLVSGPRGLREPAGPLLGVDGVRSADVVVAPGLAVDLAGHRLGRGGGSYDRALARVAAGTPVLVALYDGELLPVVPSEVNDRRVTAAVTPSGVHVVGGADDPDSGPQ